MCNAELSNKPNTASPFDRTCSRKFKLQLRKTIKTIKLALRITTHRHIIWLGMRSSKVGHIPHHQKWGTSTTINSRIYIYLTTTETLSAYNTQFRSGVHTLHPIHFTTTAYNHTRQSDTYTYITRHHDMETGYLSPQT